MEDNYKYKSLRKILTSNLLKKGINNPYVLNAINSVPRHLFFRKSLR